MAGLVRPSPALEVIPSSLSLPTTDLTTPLGQWFPTVAALLSPHTEVRGSDSAGLGEALALILMNRKQAMFVLTCMYAEQWEENSSNIKDNVNT